MQREVTHCSPLSHDAADWSGRQPSVPSESGKSENRGGNVREASAPFLSHAGLTAEVKENAARATVFEQRNPAALI